MHLLRITDTNCHCDANLNFLPIVKPTRSTNFSNLFYFGIRLHVSDSLSVHHQEFKTVHISVALRTVLNSWWWTERLSEACSVLFQNKINLRNRCFWLVLLQSYITIHGPMNVKS